MDKEELPEEQYEESLKEQFLKAEEHRVELEKVMNGKLPKYGKVKMLALKPIEGEKLCVAYFIVAKTATKQKCMDVLIRGSIQRAYEIMFDSTVIKEETDKRYFKKDTDEDYYFLSACSYCGKQISYAIEYVKKK